MFKELVKEMIHEDPQSTEASNPQSSSARTSEGSKQGRGIRGLWQEMTSTDEVSLPPSSTALVPVNQQKVEDDSLASKAWKTVRPFLGGAAIAVVERGGQTFGPLPALDEVEEWMGPEYAESEIRYKKEIIDWRKNVYGGRHLSNVGRALLREFFGFDESLQPQILEKVREQREADDQTPAQAKERDYAMVYSIIAEERGPEAADQWLDERIEVLEQRVVKKTGLPKIQRQEIERLKEFRRQKAVIISQGFIKSAISALFAGGGFSSEMFFGRGWGIEFETKEANGETEESESRVVNVRHGQDKDAVAVSPAEVLADYDLPRRLETISGEKGLWPRLWGRLGKGGRSLLPAKIKIGQRGASDKDAVVLPVIDAPTAKAMIEKAARREGVIKARIKQLADKARLGVSDQELAEEAVSNLARIPRTHVVKKATTRSQPVEAKEAVGQTDNDIIDSPEWREVPKDEQKSPDTEPSAPSGWWSEPNTTY